MSLRFLSSALIGMIPSMVFCVSATLLEANEAPVAVPGGPYTLSFGGAAWLVGSQSYDPDAGDGVVDYAWDLDNDGVYGDLTQADTILTWETFAGFFESTPAIGSTRTIGLRVTDSHGLKHVASTTLSIGGVVGPVRPLSLAAVLGPQTGNHASSVDAIGASSSDGRYIVFSSSSTDLVAGQIDNQSILTGDIFWHDRQTRETRLISHAYGSVNTTGNDNSFSPRVSGDGRYIAFVSTATDLTSDGAEGGAFARVFLHDTQTGITVQVSAGGRSVATHGGGGNYAPSISLDGRFVVFVSSATDVIEGLSDVNDSTDVFLYDAYLQTTTLISHAAGFVATTANGESVSPEISGDGRYVCYQSSASDLIAGGSDTNGYPDVFLYDIDASTTILVSRSSTLATSAATGFSYGPRISMDGRYVGFSSTAGNLVSGQVSNGTYDVFIFDRITEAMELVSHGAASTTHDGNGTSVLTAISSDGRYVVFDSSATDLVSGFVNNNGSGSDVYLYDRQAGLNILASHVPGQPLVSSSRAVESSGMSSDGRRLVLVSAAEELVDDPLDYDNDQDVFLYDADMDQVTRLSPAGGAPYNSYSASPYISSDGSTVVFESTVNNLVAGQRDKNAKEDVFVHNFSEKRTELVSRSVEATASINVDGAAPVWSADARYVAFVSEAANIVENQQDDNGVADVFLFDRATGLTVIVSHASGEPTRAGGGRSANPTISADGRFVVFTSSATNLVAGQQSGGDGDQIYVFDRESGAVALVSRASGTEATSADDYSRGAIISGNGQYIVFESYGNNLVTGQTGTTLNSANVFLHDRQAGATSLVSHAASQQATVVGGFLGGISDDGRYVVYVSRAGNLVAGQETGEGDNVFLYDRLSGTSSLVSYMSGLPEQPADRYSRTPIISGDGSQVAFLSTATNLVANLVDVNGQNGEDVYVYDVPTGNVALASHAKDSVTTTLGGNSRPSALSADGRYLVMEQSSAVCIYDTETTTLRDVGPGRFPSISGDGRYVVFESSSASLAMVDENGLSDVFLYDRIDGAVALVSRSDVAGTTTANGGSYSPKISSDGRYVVFLSEAVDLVPSATTAGGLYLFPTFPAPAFSSDSLVATGIPGVPLEPAAIAFTGEVDAFYATGLPAGLLFDLSTGVLSGTTHQAGEYPVTLYALNDAGVGVATFTLLLAKTGTFDDWRRTHFALEDIPHAEVTGAEADVDGDGVVNLLEFAFGLDPASPDADAQPLLGRDGDFLTLTYVRLKQSVGLTYLVEVSSDLKTWNSGAAFTEDIGTTSLSAALELVMVKDKTPMDAGERRRFIRLRVSNESE